MVCQWMSQDQRPINMNTDLLFLRHLRDESASMARRSDLRRIQLLANRIWREAGCPQGRHQEHWSEAERRLESEDSRD
jgi:hypothetical protein